MEPNLSNEAWYDQNVAPELYRLAKLCEQRGMSFLAQVEFEPNVTASTLSVTPGASVKTRIAGMGIACNGNVDNLIMSLMRYGEKHGHSSAALAALGVKPSC